MGQAATWTWGDIITDLLWYGRERRGESFYLFAQADGVRFEEWVHVLPAVEHPWKSVSGFLFGY